MITLRFSTDQQLQAITHPWSIELFAVLQKDFSSSSISERSSDVLKFGTGTSQQTFSRNMKSSQVTVWKFDLLSSEFSYRVLSKSRKSVSLNMMHMQEADHIGAKLQSSL